MSKKRITNLDVSLPVLIKKEGGVFVAYTPALDISTYGKSESKAKKNFEELVQVYFEEFIDQPHALDEVLDSLGWIKHKNNWQPPKITNTFQDITVPLAI